MVAKAEEIDITFENFQQKLVDKLNLDQKTANHAWESFSMIRSRYILEGDPLNWLGCAVFVACKNTVTPTVGQSILEGNCVSLTSLLRCSNLSLKEFFSKISTWARMTKLSEDFRYKIEKLEKKVTITYNTFQHEFTAVYVQVFNVPIDNESRHNRNRKQKPLPCSTKRLFEFCWLMFITVKGEMKTFDEDLVKSYQLLYALFDYLFINAFHEDRRDLINSNFPGLPDNWVNNEFRIPVTQAPSNPVINNLCKHKEDTADIVLIKEYGMKAIITSWFEKKVLQGNTDNYTGILNSAVFENNFVNLTKVYETHLLNNGDFDERIFLNEYFRQKSLKDLHTAPVSEMKGTCRSFPTPITCKRFLQNHNDNVSDSITSDLQNIAKLKTVIGNQGPEPSEEVLTIFKSLASDPTETIKEKINELKSVYHEKCLKEFGSNLPNKEIDKLDKRSNLIVILTYKLLECILKREKKQSGCFPILLQRLDFIASVFVCSVEVVEFCFNSHTDKSSKRFLWVLKTLSVPAIDMTKIIEITIRAMNGQLSRNMIKHLSFIEEMCLESLIWESDSPLWKEIAEDGNGIPKFEDVALPHQVERYLGTDEKKDYTASPGPSVLETFQSPINNSQVKKKLFDDIKPGQSLLQNSNTHIVIDTDGTKKIVRLVESLQAVAEISPQQVVTTPPEQNPRKTGRLAIIMRKFYKLAAERMFELCKRLDIGDVRQKIWTVLEYSIRETDLMKDRHLDQLLMCAIYIICKLSEKNVMFGNQILIQYKKVQPQAKSNIYRKVNGKKLEKQNDKGKEDNGGEENVKKEYEKKENEYEIVDLIQFYNSVYTDKVRKFALKFMISTERNNCKVPLSPLPSEKILNVSPRTEVVKNVFLNIFHESPTRAGNGGSTMKYCFNRSTSDDLKEINAAMNNVKRKAQEEFEIGRLRKQPKLAALIEERVRVQSKEMQNESNDEDTQISEGTE